MQTLRFFDARLIAVIVDHPVSQRLVKQAQAIGRAVMDDQLLPQLFKAELVRERLAGLRVLKARGETIMDLGLVFKELTRVGAHLIPHGKPLPRIL